MTVLKAPLGYGLPVADADSVSQTPYLTDLTFRKVFHTIQIYLFIYLFIFGGTGV
jgi:hypothetical protein